MNVLIACEFSGRIRSAFRKLGHDAWSCDLLPAEDGSPYHIIGDALEVAKSQKWNLIIYHAPCTYLCNSGVQWLYLKPETRTFGRSHITDPERMEKMRAAAKFFADLWMVDCDKVCAENSIMHGMAKEQVYRFTIDGPQLPQPYIIQPWQFGHPETKATCLWTRGLPRLCPTKLVRDEMFKLPKGEQQRAFYASPGPDRWKQRSRTLQGIAGAMATQWSIL